MKLRNKETGKVQTCDMVVITDEKIDGEIASLNKHTFIFRSIEQFNDEYEAYKPAEPLIKDEKIRKAVRAFAELNNSATIIFELSYGKSSIIARADNGFAMLWVDGESWETNGKGIKWDEPYTIAELCGEEEDCNKPAEPLIKDEKIRKIVRAWADNLQAFMCDGEITFYDDKAYRTFQTDVWKGCNIRDIAELDLVFDEDSLEDGKTYTIAELCGEEEE